MGEDPSEDEDVDTVGRYCGAHYPPADLLYVPMRHLVFEKVLQAGGTAVSYSQMKDDPKHSTEDLAESQKQKQDSFSSFLELVKASATSLAEAAQAPASVSGASMHGSGSSTAHSAVPVEEGGSPHDHRGQTFASLRALAERVSSTLILLRGRSTCARVGCIFTLPVSLVRIFGKLVFTTFLASFSSTFLSLHSSCVKFYDVSSTSAAIPA